MRHKPLGSFSQGPPGTQDHSELLSFGTKGGEPIRWGACTSMHVCVHVCVHAPQRSRGTAEGSSERKEGERDREMEGEMEDREIEGEASSLGISTTTLSPSFKHQAR